MEMGKEEVHALVLENGYKWVVARYLPLILSSRVSSMPGASRTCWWDRFHLHEARGGTMEEPWRNGFFSQQPFSLSSAVHWGYGQSVLIHVTSGPYYACCSLSRVSLACLGSGES